MNALRRDLKIAPGINVLRKRLTTKAFQLKNIPGSSIKLCSKEPGEMFEAVNGRDRRNGDGPAAPIRIYCPATMRLKTRVGPWKETSRVPSGKKTEIVQVCVSSPDVSFNSRVAFTFT